MTYVNLGKPIGVVNASPLVDELCTGLARDILYAIAGVLVLAAVCGLILGIVALVIRFHPRILGPIDAEVKLAQIRDLCEHSPVEAGLRAELLAILR